MANNNLRKSVAVMAKFTNKFNPGYGKTPGKFVVNYIARDGATESLTPISDSVQQSLSHYVTRYLSREAITDEAIQKYDSRHQLQRQLHDMDNLTGRSFGNLGLSYSKNQLLSQADHLQTLYQQGHSIEKLVISFTSDYAKQQGVLPSNYQHIFRGDFRGQVDQLKLRLAVNNGMRKMAHRAKYTNPVWMGSIQVDTNHLHVHMVLGDDVPFYKSNRLGIFYGHKEERGKLTPLERDGLRDGIQSSLLSHHSMHHFHTQTDLDTQAEHSNVQTLVQSQFGDNTQIQLILASLPQNRSLWDADSDEPIMKRPNELMDGYLNDLTFKYDTQLGYTDTLSSLKSLSRQESRQTYQSLKGTDQFFAKHVHDLRLNMKNQIYHQLNELLDKNPKLLSTSFITQSARDPEALKANIQYAFTHPNQNADINMMLFTYRMTSYHQRLDDHLKKSKMYHQSVKNFDQEALNSSDLNQESFALRRHYQSELKYHDSAIDKYRYFFKVDGHNDDKMVNQFQSTVSGLKTQRQQILAQGQRDGLWSINTRTGQSWQSFRLQRGNQLLTDVRVGDFLRQPLEHPQGEIDSVGLSIIRAMQQPTYVLPDQSAEVLDDIGNMLPEYELSGTDMQPATQKPNPSPSYALLSLMARYSLDVDDASVRMFTSGVLPANQEIDGLSTLHQFQEFPELSNIPQVPMPKNRDKFLTHEYFNQVKGVDLDDLGFDFSPHMTRNVNENVANQYHQLTQRRSDSVNDVVRFFMDTKQTRFIPSLSNLRRQLANNRKLSQFVDTNHQLPLGALANVDLSFDSNRQFKSINLQQANETTKTQLSLIRDVNYQAQMAAQSPVPSRSSQRHQSRQSPS